MTSPAPRPPPPRILPDSVWGVIFAFGDLSLCVPAHTHTEVLAIRLDREGLGFIPARPVLVPCWRMLSAADFRSLWEGAFPNRAVLPVIPVTGALSYGERN